MTYEEFDEIFYDHIDKMICSYSTDLGINYHKVWTALDRKDIFNGMKDALRSVVIIEEEE